MDVKNKINELIDRFKFNINPNTYAYTNEDLNQFGPVKFTDIVYPEMTLEDSFKINPLSMVNNDETLTPPKDSNSIKEFFNNAWTKAKGMGGNALKYMKKHPGTSTFLGITGAANLGGLLDNDKIGGQLIGAGLGGAAAHFLPKLVNSSFNVPSQVAIALGGGAIGSLFDSLRAKREQEQRRYYGGY